ncbi:hypothetical protein AGABI1DRAFT_73378 [Agaricus bisporus var. burnettii JB137-S8]|uniref:UBC core domain-containing protein n=1 Tax=Agaricus bisporus var. burnettii (strain JB137-S8 / ATCC MYA-4627 / FGSC 10392) TaxID=597362 RepID=K5XY87_AGABU|nr:uncharacterized protein AGABI1DRAFT_73378 [Agaricus bisporus var. burnettii JB137-S8]EKM80305.1 hypothetical protein AGABI1DRAFT_73378 [Agaricus bisporus var. burnettii JB137-S8]
MLGPFTVSPLTTAVQPKAGKPFNNHGVITSTNSKSDVPSAPSIVAQTALSLEYASLRHQNHCPLGIYIVPSPDSLFVWDAVLYTHQGYYAGAILRFRVTFPSDYPDNIPAVQFITDIFHPLIDQSGFFNLSAHFRPWKPREHRIHDVLYCIKAAFKKYRLDQIKEVDAWNKEAYRYHESTFSFSALAAQSSQLTRSESALYDKDHPSFAGQPTEGLVFQKLSPDMLREYRQTLGLHEWLNDE